MNINSILQPIMGSIKTREDTCWAMAEVFLANRDAHGLHDMGVEIQALQRAAIELEKLRNEI